MRFSSALTGLSALLLLFGMPLDSGVADLFEVREPIPASVYVRSKTAKRTACFLTINSTDEKRAFTKHLNGRDWDLVELAEAGPDGGRAGWFARACASRVSCDILVISGHFAGRFFGSSGFSLGLDELESHSCAQDCGGILKDPKEVYLFGCNTLATKDRDRRTPEEYYRVLRADGYSAEAARRVVEDRYGAFGQDNRAKMRRIFSGVDYVYGYHSISPLGAKNGPLLDSYLRGVGDFTRFHDEQVSSRATAEGRPNTALARSLNGTNFTQCSGISADDPEYEFHLQICKLFDRAIPLADRVRLVEGMLDSDKLIAMLPSIQRFLRANLREIKIDHAAGFERLRTNRRARTLLVDALAGVKSPSIKIEWMRFAHLMGWVERSELAATVYAMVDNAFKASSIDADTAASICTLEIPSLARMDFSGIVARVTPSHLASHSAATVMACTGLSRYPAFRTKVLEHYSARSSDTKTLATIFADAPAVGALGANDSVLIARLLELCRTRPLGAGDPACGKALATLGGADPATVAHLVGVLRSSPTGLHPAYASAFAKLSVDSPSLEEAVLERYFDRSNRYAGSWETYLLARPLSDPTAQAKLLAYLGSNPAGRRPDETVFALRRMATTEAAIDALLTALRTRRVVLITAPVLNGFLNLAESAGASTALIERVLGVHDSIVISSETHLEAFYAAIELPRVREALRSSERARTSVCKVATTARYWVGESDVGDVVPARVRVKTCEEILAAIGRR